MVSTTDRIHQDKALVQQAVDVLQDHLQEAHKDLELLQQAKEDALRDPEGYVQRLLAQKDKADVSTSIRQRRQQAIQQLALPEINWRALGLRGMDIPQQLQSHHFKQQPIKPLELQIAPQQPVNIRRSLAPFKFDQSTDGVEPEEEIVTRKERQSRRMVCSESEHSDLSDGDQQK